MCFSTYVKPSFLWLSHPHFNDIKNSIFENSKYGKVNLYLKKIPTHFFFQMPPSSITWMLSCFTFFKENLLWWPERMTLYSCELLWYFCIKWFQNFYTSWMFEHEQQWKQKKTLTTFFEWQYIIEIHTNDTLVLIIFDLLKIFFYIWNWFT